MNNEELIKSARERAMVGADVDPIDAARLLNELADEVEARQVDEEALADVIRKVQNRSALIADVDLPTYTARAVVEFLGERHEPEPGEPDACLDHKPVQHRDGKPPWCNACGRATVPDAVPDAREHLHAKCDCVPDLGPAHCHLCSEKAGSPVQWAKCEAVISAPDAATEGTFKKAEAFDKAVALSERRQTLLEEAEADRDAATAAIERVRALHKPLVNSMSGLYPEPLCTCGVQYPCPTIAALDGAPEPDNGSGYEYVCGGKEIQG